MANERLEWNSDDFRDEILRILRAARLALDQESAAATVQHFTDRADVVMLYAAWKRSPAH